MQTYAKERLLKALENGEIPVHHYQAIVVGSGCAAFNAADSLFDEGVTDVAIVTEGVNMGTSRNTGSDKQTYYKLSLASSEPDSVYDMARTLFEGGCVHGDTALIEAALSTRCFFKLVQLGVPFPHDAYGQYVGYKTDHDPKQRATSCGPLTSHYMTEVLEKSVRKKEIPVLEPYRVIAILTVPEGKTSRAAGLLAINRKAGHEDYDGVTLFSSGNIVWATGGPSAIYYRSVYPTSQTGAQGAALMAGAAGTNLTEWQYGIASTQFRWNLSGSYQQVIPTYISTDENGEDAREFLHEYFQTERDLLCAIFLKGYQWPFDPRKLQPNGSSMVDLAVYQEIVEKGRRVFLDYRRNPQELGTTPDFTKLREEALSYLRNSGALQKTPVERLRAMNEPAYELYLSHGIDLEKQALEAAVCAQHNNGGLSVDAWWQSNVKGLFPAGECAGTFGVYRPGGTALNSTQVGSLRAAQYIARRGAAEVDWAAFYHAAERALTDFLLLKEALRKENPAKRAPMDLRQEYQKSMDRCAAFVRKPKEMEQQLQAVRGHLKNLGEETAVRNHTELLAAFQNRDILLTQLTYLSAMLFYVDSGGGSRGSYLVEREDPSGENAPGVGYVEESRLNAEQLTVENCFRPVRPLPQDAAWFENVYNDYREGRVIG